MTLNRIIILALFSIHFYVLWKIIWLYYYARSVALISFWKWFGAEFAKTSLPDIISNVANLRKIYLISLNFLIHISTTKISIYQVFSPGSFLRIYIADCIPIREIRFNKNCHKYPEAEFFFFKQVYYRILPTSSKFRE